MFPVAMAAVVMACGSFGEDSSSDSVPDSGTLADGDATRLPSEAGVGPAADAAPGLSNANDSGTVPSLNGLETSPCTAADILFCEDFEDPSINVIDGSRLRKNDFFAATLTLASGGHDNTGLARIVLPNDDTKVHGEVYFTLKPQKALYEIVFRSAATNGFDVGGVALTSFESGITLTRGSGTALDLWDYSGSGGSNRGTLASVAADASSWSYAAIEVDPSAAQARFEVSAGPVGQAPSAPLGVTVTADFSAGIRYHFGPYRNEMPGVMGVYKGAATVEVDWVRVTAR